MKKMLRRLYILVFSFFITLPLVARGLQISGNSYKVEERGSYTVFKESLIPSFENEVDIHFDLQIKEFNTFGYIFRLVDLESQNTLSLVFTYKNDRESLLQINLDGKTSYASIPIQNDSIRYRWIPVSLELNSNDKSIKFIVGGTQSEVRNVNDFKDVICPDIHFGRDGFIVDVPTFALRNLKIENAQQHYFFPLNENKGEEVHESSGEVYGHVINPKWLINDSFFWKPIFEKYIVGACGANFDEENKKIYFFSQDSLFSFDLHRKAMHGIPYKNTIPLKMRLGTNFYSTKDNKLYVYEINGIPLGNPTMASLDLDKGEWNPVDSLSLPAQLHHHNYFFNHQSNRLLLFGGFGNQKYHNALISYDFKGHSIDTLKLTGDVIAPRFVAGMAHVGDSLLYIYGGVGNTSGEQTLGRVYFNDLYKINLLDYKVTKHWNNPLEEKEAVGNQMICSEKENALYALRYKDYKRNSFAQLYRISIDKGDIMPVGDSIPFLSVAIETSLSLYQSHMPEKLYCVIQEHYGIPSDTVKISAYELDFPPLSNEELTSFHPDSGLNNKIWIIMCSIVVAICLIGTVLYLLKRKKIALKQDKITDLQDENTIECETVLSSVPMDISINPSIKSSTNNTLYLFGDFTVYNRDGRDITYMFSNKLKHLFIYILLSSVNGDGVQSSSLNTLFWPDKDESKVKNLKGVTINHLRKILAEIDGISLDYYKGAFKLSFEPVCFCDYVVVNDLISQQRVERELLTLLQRGKFLRGVEDELFDLAKNKVEDFILSYLVSLLSSKEKPLDKEDVIIVCRLIFEIDPINEQALQCLMEVCREQKMKSEAQKYYAHFVREYRRMQGKEYPVAFDDLMKK